MFRKKDKKMKSLKPVENKGQGDCLFYAIANGIAVYLKSHDLNQRLSHETNQAQVILERLLTYIDAHPELKIRTDEFIQGIMTFEFDYRKKEVDQFLQQCNHLLRHMLYTSRLDDLNKDIRDGHITSNISFSSALAIYHNTTDLGSDEDFSKDKALVEAIAQFRDIYPDLSFEKLKTLFSAFLLGNEETRTKILEKKDFDKLESVDENSILAQVLRKKTQDKTWGTENDARRLAEELGFQLDIYHESKQQAGEIDPTKPVIRINNFLLAFGIEASRHWQTYIPLFNQLTEKEVDGRFSAYVKFEKGPLLTIDEVINVLKDYTKPFGFKEHKTFFKNLILQCEQTDTYLESVMDFIIAETPKHKPNGQLRTCLDYLCLRYRGENYETLRAAWDAAHDRSPYSP